MSIYFFQAHCRLSENQKIIRIGLVEPKVGGLLDLSLFTDITSPNQDLPNLIEAELEAGSNDTTPVSKILLVNKTG